MTLASSRPRLVGGPRFARATAKGKLGLVLLCHKFFCRDRLPIGAAQHGHRDRVVASAKINLLRIVAIEFGTWRSVRSGGASGSVTAGNGKFREQRGGTRS